MRPLHQKNVDEHILRAEALQAEAGGTTILDGVSITLARHEKTAVTGPSGSGKSTLLKCLAGLAPISGGSVRVDGVALNAQNVWELRRRMAWVPQEPDLGNGTVREALEHPFEYRANRHLVASLGRVPALMEQLLLPAVLLNKPVSTLSGGEKQRFALLSALLLDRPILLLDEPTSALDAVSRDAVCACLAAARDLSVLCVSHDPAAAAFCGRTLVMEGGRLMP